VYAGISQGKLFDRLTALSKVEGQRLMIAS